MNRFLIIIFFGFSLSDTYAQELNCKVEVNYSQVQGVDPSVFQKLKKDIFDFMNNRKWTADVYSIEEKLECNLFITISAAPSVDRYSGTMQIQSFRPVYGTTYKSIVLDINDNYFNFNYTPSQTLDYSDNEFLSNLTSILAYYAYVMLAFDYDSYSLKGGSDFFSKAQGIINNTQNVSEMGWKATDAITKNRYWLMENLMNEVYEPIRVCTYNYHRLGLDVMSQDAEKGRKSITDGLKLLESVNRRKPNSYSIKVFFDSKNQEIINLYKDDSVGEKQEMLEYLSRVDPGNSSRYIKIIQK